jgi:hypothetical protein
MVRLGSIEIPDEFVRGINTTMDDTIVIRGAVLEEDVKAWFINMRRLKKGEILQLASPQVNGVMEIESVIVEEKIVGEKKLFSFHVNFKQVA